VPTNASSGHSPRVATHLSYRRIHANGSERAYLPSVVELTVSAVLVCANSSLRSAKAGFQLRTRSSAVAGRPRDCICRETYKCSLAVTDDHWKLHH